MQTVHVLIRPWIAASLACGLVPREDDEDDEGARKDGERRPSTVLLRVRKSSGLSQDLACSFAKIAST